MARKTARPGRTLVVFFLGLAISYGLVALAGTWKPELGLDLKGGTRITLIANDSPSSANLKEAANIIDQRVNGTGVTEAEVTTQGSKYIVVEIPGPTNNSLVDTVKRQAQLRFRLVACASSTGTACGGASTPGTDSGNGVTVNPSPGGQPSGQPSSEPSASPKNRAPFLVADKDKKDKSDGTKSPSASPSSSPTESPASDPSSTPTDGSTPTSAPANAEQTKAEQKALEACATAAASDKNLKDPLTWMKQPTPECVTAYNNYVCPPNGAVSVDDQADLPLVTCDEDGVKYLLSAAAIEGTDLDSSSAGVPQGQIGWVVNLKIGGAGKDEFTKISRALYGTDDQFAVVLDGKVLSAPQMNGLITNGEAQISGNFTEDSARSLATSLKYGALPISFEKNGTSVEEIGASLAGDQLTAGITAGIAGLLLVMLYCLIYYRGLGVVVIASLLVAGATTYAMVLLLSKAAGFTLTLPGIAGLIVAVGITADSFIVYFERIRDEMRDGKSMRVAVEAGWKRARNTCLAADTVSLLAAVVLYIFAAGVVKGFAFALGLSTIIDLAIFFWFTHPMVSYLARYRFFNQGHKLSGLDPEALGIDRLPAGGRA
ncbi:MAG: protein-export rane protein SecD [Nocardioides sp.]|nr:protein-export rane protein SecD [Nocardioides sp.]